MLHYTYGCGTLSTAYVGYLYLENHWLKYCYWCGTVRIAYVGYFHVQNYLVSIYLWVSSLKYSLCWLVLPSESRNYTTFMRVQP